MPKAELFALLDRVRASTGPDRELNRALAEEILQIEWRPYMPRARTLWGYYRDTGKVAFYDTQPSAYTASIDAALTLAVRALPSLLTPEILLSDAIDRMGREGWGGKEAIQAVIARFVVIEVLEALIASEAGHAER